MVFQYPQILGINAGGPCSETDLSCGDYIVEIDGNSVMGRKPQDIVIFTLGVEGSIAKITARRGLQLTIRILDGISYLMLYNVPQEILVKFSL